MASVASHVGSRYTAPYSASKHAVLGFMRAVAAEVAGTDVTANCRLPGLRALGHDRPHDRHVEARTGQDGEAALARMAPLGRLVEPEEVAFAVAFLAAREAAAINGQSLIMDGGGVQQ